MNPNRSTLGLVLSWAWIAILSAYMIWGLINESGLYAWLLNQQVERWGYYYPKFTAVLPILVLGAPALLYLRRRDQEKRATLAAQGPTVEARAMRRNAVVMALAGLVLIAVGVGAWLLSQSVPDGSEPPVSFDAATLGTVPAPEQRVIIRGTVDPNVATQLDERGASVDSSTLYVGFRPDGDTTDKDAPTRLFVARRMGSTSDAPVSQGFYPEQEGRLVENGLPPIARRELESRGISVADPHWVLQSGSGETPRDTYYIVAGVGGLVGFVFILVGLIGLAQASRRSRAAQAG